MPLISEVTADTLTHLLEALSRFSEGGPGITRLVYGPAWCQAHRWLADEARRLGLEATADAAGNLYFHPSDVIPGSGREVLLIGSHVDTVVNGGALDGAYGVVVGLLIAAELAGRAKIPVVGFVTCEEDEARFGAQMIGARTMLGRARVDELDRVKDADGVTWRAALQNASLQGCAGPPEPGDLIVTPRFRAGMVFEAHIEQGPVLEAAGLSVGIVNHIAGFTRLRVVVTGQARHAGTTPMGLRHDALAAVAEMILAAETLAIASDEATRITAGNARPSPGLYNVVPGACEAWFEVRHAEPATLDALAAELDRHFREIARRRGVKVTIDSPSHLAPTPLSGALVKLATSLAKEMGLKHMLMPSGAGHDTMVFAQAGIPGLMVFVPSKGGISHSPDEFTTPEQLWDGYRLTREVARRLTVDKA
jgi:allantoate deiminase